ncbi:MAG TPA: ABC transporter ATP-binding protein [Candidatus Acidoferrales bacterium]|nr:ABC transporter ATP-binding protein [Candidatus Acidoferrales bacterium]
MSEAVIQVENLGKQFHVGKLKAGTTLRDALTNAVKAPFQRRAAGEDTTLWALRGVSFEVKQGEVVGLIGRNGAGKSTLLKLLARITRPTVGWAEVKGRIGSLLEVGTGFHPELSGRENVFLSGAILGMKKAEIQRKFDEIVAFSEVERFLDTPLKHYSSGMQMRLAFAVAAHLEPEILLVDEVLAVGDVAFQTKCLGKMREVARHGRTILFVSHNPNAVASLCSAAILLEGGLLSLYSSSVSDVLRRYSNQAGLADVVDLRGHPNRLSPTSVFEEISFRDLGGAPCCSFLPGERVSVFLKVRPFAKVRGPRISIGFTNARGERAFALGTHIGGTLISDVEGPKTVRVRFLIPPLVPGQYTLDIGFYDWLVSPLDEIIGAVAIDVRRDESILMSDPYGPHVGHILVRSEWDWVEEPVEMVYE